MTGAHLAPGVDDSDDRFAKEFLAPQAHLLRALAVRKAAHVAGCEPALASQVLNLGGGSSGPSSTLDAAGCQPGYNTLLEDHDQNSNRNDADDERRRNHRPGEGELALVKRNSDRQHTELWIGIE